MNYHIKSNKGYWLSGGFGYTKKKSEAGIFTSEELLNHNLDGCTLLQVEPHGYGKFSIKQIQPTAQGKT